MKLPKSNNLNTKLSDIKPSTRPSKCPYCHLLRMQSINADMFLQCNPNRSTTAAHFRLYPTNVSKQLSQKIPKFVLLYLQMTSSKEIVFNCHPIPPRNPSISFISNIGGLNNPVTYSRIPSNQFSCITSYSRWIEIFHCPLCV